LIVWDYGSGGIWIRLILYLMSSVGFGLVYG